MFRPAEFRQLLVAFLFAHKSDVVSVQTNKEPQKKKNRKKENLNGKKFDSSSSQGLSVQHSPKDVICAKKESQSANVFSMRQTQPYHNNYPTTPYGRRQ